MPTWTSTTVWTATLTASITVLNLVTAAAQEVPMKKRRVRSHIISPLCQTSVRILHSQCVVTLFSLYQVTLCHFTPTGASKWWTTANQSLSPSPLREGVGLLLWTICQRQMVLLFNSKGKPSITFNTLLMLYSDITLPFAKVNMHLFFFLGVTLQSFC